ncbi:MAG: hypothetical protein J5563_02835 [Clostridia bacterium]|nr:hypothetical protein [Clostridia bacterium]
MKKTIVLMLTALIVLASCSRGGQSQDTGVVTDFVSVSETPGYIPGADGSFGTVGLYVWNNNQSQYSFWKKIGITTLQFCDRGWWYNSENGSLDSYLSGMASGVRQAKNAGFKVYVILFSNLEQYKGPNNTEPTGLGVKFHPDDTEKWAERLDYLKKTVSMLKNADGFTFFAGDPGGITNSMGKGSFETFVKMAADVRDMVSETAPGAEFNINTWAVTMFQTPSVSAETPQFWQRETENCKKILEIAGFVGDDAGIELPCHDYYRPLALRLYAKYNMKPEQKYPQKDDIEVLAERGTGNIWAWPYFLLDEADDGDRGGTVKTDLPQIETRYICKYINSVRELGFNGIIGSWSYAGYQNKCLNTYAFARMANDSTLTPEQVISEFASLIATEQTAGTLTEILKFIENDSNFEKKLPKSERIEPFQTSFSDVGEALDALEDIDVLEKSAISLPITPGEYLSKLAERLKLMND